MKLSKTTRTLIEEIPETAWQTVSDYPDGGQAQVAESDLKGFRLIVRRARLTGKQAELFPNWRHHAFATNRPSIPVLVADTDHRDHATIELAIRDLIDQALRHFPSGRSSAAKLSRRPHVCASPVTPSTVNPPTPAAIVVSTSRERSRGRDAPQRQTPSGLPTRLHGGSRRLSGSNARDVDRKVERGLINRCPVAVSHTLRKDHNASRFEVVTRSLDLHAHPSFE